MKKNKQIQTALGILVIAGAIVFVIYLSAQSSWAYYYTVDELMQSDLYNRANQSGQPVVRIAGFVAEDSINADIENMQIDFRLKGQTSSIIVKYKGMMPKNFEPGKEVVVEGRLADKSTLSATLILTRCESKYTNELKSKIEPEEK